MLLTEERATGFMSLVEGSSSLQVSLLDEEESTTQVFTREGDLWISNGEYLREEEVVEFLSNLASDCMAYKIEISQRDQDDQSRLPIYS